MIIACVLTSQFLSQVVLLRLMGNQVKQGLGREPGGGVLAKRLERLLGLCVANFLECGVRMGARGHGNQLRLAEALEGDEPIDSSLNRSPGGQQAVVAQDGSLFAAEGLGDDIALRAAQDDAVELVVQRDIVVEGASVL